ncbi:tRNA-dependent cyclodipeptide synthase [Candidatus Endomicrobiellum pyrsonymphae]|uniref:tRNA-dependent cyclodipeptide synthase n=1 Tax=Candidatus Endomicrobiellum pyrsonymphae TaxID=1408203 RepID=UPI0035A8319A
MFLATSKTVLASKGFLGDMSDEAVCVAVKYFIAELPVYLNVPDSINISSYLYAYKDTLSGFLTGVYNKDSPLFICFFKTWLFGSKFFLNKEGRYE